MSAPRFFIVFPDGRESIGLHSMHQVKVCLERSVPDAKQAIVYERTYDAIRDGWSLQRSSKRSSSVAKKSVTLQKRTPSKKDSVIYKTWTQPEIRKHIDLWNRGVSVRDISKETGRTVSAIYAKLNKYPEARMR